MYNVTVLYAYSFRTIGNSERTAQQLRDEWYQVHVHANFVCCQIIYYRDYVYGIGNVLISRDTPPNAGHNTLVCRGHEGTKYLSKLADTGSC